MNKPTSRHALLIFAYNNPIQLQKLVNALQHNQFDIFLHINRSERDPQLMNIAGCIRIMSLRNTYWGSCNMVEAVIDLLKISQKHNNYNTYSLLSGSDFPIKTNQHIYDTLSSLNESHIEYWHKTSASFHERYTRLYFNNFPRHIRIPANAISRRLSKYLPGRKFPRGLTPSFGSALWTLRKEEVLSVLNFCASRPEVVSFMRYTLCSDELFFHTVLKYTTSKEYLNNDSLRYIEWTSGRHHPNLLTHGHLNALRMTSCLFARKFDERQTPGIIEELNNIRAHS
jgi:hypothetical protein